MSTDAPEYPITKLLLKIIDESGLSQVEFVRRLGYPYAVERGLRRLQLWLYAGQGYDRIIKEIIAVYPNRQNEVWGAIADTRNIKAAEDEAIRKHATPDIEERLRRQFKPFIWISTAETAHSFWAAVIERRTKVLWMEEGFDLLSERERLAAARKCVVEHYAGAAGKSAFGKILGYRFVPTFNNSVTLDVNGEVIEKAENNFSYRKHGFNCTPNRNPPALRDRPIEPTALITPVDSYVCPRGVLHLL